MRFTIIAASGSDPGDARARASAVVTADGPDAVAAAARASADSYVLLLAAGARPRSGAFAGVASALGARTGVLGAAAHAARVRFFGWMLGPAPCGPLPFELVPIAAPVEQAGTDAAVRGPIDVVAPGMVLAARDLLLEPLPADPVAALVELCARARAAGREVMCRPSFACDAPPFDSDDRGRAAALRAVAEQRPELTGTHRLTPAMRRTTVERELRLDGGRRTRVRVALPPLTVLVHGAGAALAARRARELAPNIVVARAVDDPATALRAEMRVRGDRYVLVAGATALPDAAQLDALVAALESAPFVALAAPDAGALDGRCVLIALARFPQHVEAHGTSLPAAIDTLVCAAHALRRAVRAPGAAPPSGVATITRRATRRASIVFLAASLPEIMRITLDALVPALRRDDELIAVCAANAHTTHRILAAYPQLRIEMDAADPLLGAGANRAIGATERELVILVADDVLLPPGVVDTLRATFARIPALGAAFPAVPGAPGGEGVVDVTYADLGQLRGLAAKRRTALARRAEPIDLAVSPVLAVAVEAFGAVGGIAPAYGPTRRGIADLVLRLRAAGYAVVRCDDALAHRFEPSLSRNPAAVAGAQQLLPPPNPAALARGFDPARRVPFDHDAAAARGGGVSHAVAVPVASAAELERAAIFVGAAAAAFDAGAPVRIHLLLDGGVTPGHAVARVRPVLAASGKPMHDSVAVRIERAADLAAWRAAVEPGIRVLVAAGHARDAFADLTSVARTELNDLLEPVAR